MIKKSIQIFRYTITLTLETINVLLKDITQRKKQVKTIKMATTTIEISRKNAII